MRILVRRIVPLLLIALVLPGCFNKKKQQPPAVAAAPALPKAQPQKPNRVVRELCEGHKEFEDKATRVDVVCSASGKDKLYAKLLIGSENTCLSSIKAITGINQTIKIVTKADGNTVQEEKEVHITKAMSGLLYTVLENKDILAGDYSKVKAVNEKAKYSLYLDEANKKVEVSWGENNKNTFENCEIDKNGAHEDDFDEAVEKLDDFTSDPTDAKRAEIVAAYLEQEIDPGLISALMDLSIRSGRFNLNEEPLATPDKDPNDGDKPDRTGRTAPGADTPEDRDGTKNAPKPTKPKNTPPPARGAKEDADDAPKGRKATVDPEKEKAPTTRPVSDEKDEEEEDKDKVAEGRLSEIEREAIEALRESAIQISNPISPAASSLLRDDRGRDEDNKKKNVDNDPISGQDRELIVTPKEWADFLKKLVGKKNIRDFWLDVLKQQKEKEKKKEAEEAEKGEDFIGPLPEEKQPTEELKKK